MALRVLPGLLYCVTLLLLLSPIYVSPFVGCFCLGFVLGFVLVRCVSLCLGCGLCCKGYSPEDVWDMLCSNAVCDEESEGVC